MSADYSTNDPKGWLGNPALGAAHGRPTIEGKPVGPITVRRSPLDRQGYDRNGTYFGGRDGHLLFWYSDEDGNVEGMLTEVDIDDASMELARKFKGVHILKGPPLVLPCWGAGEDPCPDKADAQEHSDLCEECELDEVQAEEEEDDDDE